MPCAKFLSSSPEDRPTDQIRSLGLASAISRVPDRGNMSSDEESSSHSEEEDEVGELPEIDEEEMRKIQERGGKRRFSVSSESASSVKCVELPTPPGLHAQHAPRAASRGRPEIDEEEMRKIQRRNGIVHSWRRLGAQGFTPSISSLAQNAPTTARSRKAPCPVVVV